MFKKWQTNHIRIHCLRQKYIVLFSPLYAKQENNGQQYTLIKIPTTKPKMYNKGKLCKFPNISTPTRT